MLKILSIDDSRAIHVFLTDIFNQYNVSLDHAYEGKSGVSKVLDQKNVYDLILLDWEMPELTGPEVFKKFKESTVQTPVIMLTSKNELKDIEQMLFEGVSEYVMKPFTPEILIEKVEIILKQSLPKK